ncbi:MAG: histidine phosphatase family protein [Candidatus Heimdallarchaeota archaeon]|nr:histidine phosphatase family protein [Candidatus Heimdallarchaeota archaeon]MCK4876655.1 histidine phosphatase family protein [Candidatus Heimdallarchaeota archaeon]
MSNEFIFLRHALTKIDPSKPADQWELSEEGIRNIKEIVLSGVFDNVDLIIASAENKAIQTASYIANKIDKKIVTEASFNELNRGFSFKVNKNEYDKIVEKALIHWEECIDSWESARSTLDRFLEGVKIVNQEYSDKKIIVVCHGINLSLYFAHLLNIPDNQLFLRWKNLEFCAWGIVKNKKVVIDIVK